MFTHTFTPQHSTREFRHQQKEKTPPQKLKKSTEAFNIFSPYWIKDNRRWHKSWSFDLRIDETSLVVVRVYFVWEIMGKNS